MELQNANLTTYCIPFCRVEVTIFIPVASEAVYVHFPSQENLYYSQKKVYL
jgi:hypothetical protein